MTLVPGATVPAEFRKFARRGKLDIINGQVLDLPNGMLKKLAAHPDVFRIHANRPIGAHNYRTSVTVGAATVHETLGLTGAGIGVAVIDSGVHLARRPDQRLGQDVSVWQSARRPSSSTS